MDAVDPSVDVESEQETADIFLNDQDTFKAVNIDESVDTNEGEALTKVILTEVFK